MFKFTIKNIFSKFAKNRKDEKVFIFNGHCGFDLFMSEFTK
jgi:hypothetical protein